MKVLQSNKALYGPPGGVCHASCTVVMFASQDPRQSPGARKLERYVAQCAIHTV